MKRLVILGTTFVVALAATVGISVHVLHDAAVETAKPLYARRDTILSRLDQSAVPHSPFVAWLGDSTILAWGGGGSYAMELGRRPPLPSDWIVGHFGFDPFAYYFLMDAVLERRPRAVVLIANLRLLGSTDVRPMTHLAEQLPASELPHAALLPLNARGWTLPRLLLVRLLRTDSGLDALYFLDGVRELWQGSETWGFAGATRLPDEIALPIYGRDYERSLGVYDAPLRESTPSVRVLGAAVGMASRRGVPALVIVSAIPWHLLEQKGWYGCSRFEARIAAIKRVVEANGGKLLDLHRQVDEDGFRDDGGHFNRAGTERMADAVEPSLRALVESPPTRP